MVSSLWLDKLRTVPVIGLRFTPLYRANATVMNDLGPLLSRWAENKWRPEIKLDAATNLTIDLRSGYSFTITHEDVLANFSYRATVITHPDQDPSVELSQTPDIYTNLLDSVGGRLSEVFDYAFKNTPRHLCRIGIVAQTNLEPTRLPPGIKSLVNHLGNPWVEGLEAYNVLLTAKLKIKDGVTDKCHHTIKRLESQDGIDQVSLVLDWQRVFEKPVAVSSGRLTNLITQCKSDAIEYFSTFGLGDLRYDD